MTKRKKYSKEFKLDAISLVLEQNYSRVEAARSLDINANMLGRWIKQHQDDDGHDPGVVPVVEVVRDVLLAVHTHVRNPLQLGQQLRLLPIRRQDGRHRAAVHDFPNQRPIIDEAPQIQQLKANQLDPSWAPGSESKIKREDYCSSGITDLQEVY